MDRSRRSRTSRSNSYSRSRSRSPHRSSHRRQRKRESPPRSRHVDAIPPSLPLGAMPLSKRDLARYEPMFGMYLDIQKGIDIAEISEREMKGRWKSFMGKWNRGELAEGWYDPKTFEKARDSGFSRGPSQSHDSRRGSDSLKRRSPSYDECSRKDRSATPTEIERSMPYDGQIARIQEQPTAPARSIDSQEDDDEDSYGPQIPIDQIAPSTSRDLRRIDKSGPKIPTIQDLQLQRENAIASAEEARESQRLSHKQSIKSHKSELRHLEDEIAPRAEPGTRERRLEKRRELASSNRAFAETRRGASPGEAPDTELMGGGGDLETLKREREKEKRKKNEREIRKEEMLRARAAEREEKLKTYRKKEEETMGYLRALAREKFG